LFIVAFAAEVGGQAAAQRFVALVDSITTSRSATATTRIFPTIFSEEEVSKWKRQAHIAQLQAS